ncbi:aminoglycoside phosphotransferase family protein [Microlunatus panaciterrae]|uniref:Streptomycin 6-kinase n=1 Tax=Microlunatus panaciterrae TaxID=400768 RepID=A0ABS2REZ7_9ACTN|nr:aminoglycoside phosphotransferase family protein [Microlunatus panaciterrae]MBM7797571.1 streptomycin 6-kinase [Microlunatus panaciterrae]
MATTKIIVPEGLAASHDKYFGAAGRKWVDELPKLAADGLDRWQLRPDGEPTFGAVALVLPVVRADETLAVLKLQPVDEETCGEPLALTSWAGLGAVSLLEHDAGSGSMLLERLDATRSLASVADDAEALQVIAVLLTRLNAAPAPAGLRRLADLAAAMLTEAPRILAELPDGTDRRLLVACADHLRELLTEPVEERLLHWDLHYFNVLASLGDQQEPWRVIDPKPLVGDPGFELLPALWNRWDEVVATGNVTRAVLHRFDLMTDITGLDRSRARAWTLARVLQNALWDLGKFGETAVQPSHRAIAQSLLGRDS